MSFMSFCLNKKNYCLYKYVLKNYCLYKYVLSVFLS